jgi:N-methylhydantoinase A
VTTILGVDVGGTFTDVVAATDSGAIHAAKSPSTPPDYSQGILNALEQLAGETGTTVEEILADCAYVAHGTTSSLNAILTGSVPAVGFLATVGHSDSIFIMNVEAKHLGHSPEDVQDILRQSKPPRLVPKTHTRELIERVDKAGRVVVPLDEDAARAAISDLLALGVKAIAVSLLWSFLNPAHEQRVRELIREADPSVFTVLSSDVSPRMREFSRHATTIMSAQIAPALQDYLQPLEQDLQRRRLDAPLLIMQSSGGTIASQEAPNHAISTVGSVLAGGVIGATKLASQLGHRNVIATDVGGTTFLAGLIVGGEPIRGSTDVLNHYPINVSTLRVQAIGSGGGAIAWLDGGGNLRVGPRSAAAVPGPACYGQGGTEATVTDADLLLGIINETSFLGGRKPLRRSLAADALSRLGKPLGLSAVEAAAAIYAVQNAQTADLLRKVVLEQGLDPRDFTVYSYGGAGPMHCAAYTQELGAAEVVVPLGSVAAAFSAYGLVTSSLGVTRELSDPQTWPVDPARMQRNFEMLEAQVRDTLQRQGVQTLGFELRRELDCRFAQQLNEVATPVPAGDIGETEREDVLSAFERLYEELYGAGTSYREAGVHVITYRVHGTGRLPFQAELPDLGAAAARSDAATPNAAATRSPAVKERREVFLAPERGFEKTSIYDYAALLPGHVITGPAVVEVPTTTVVVLPGTSAVVDRFGNVLMTVR